MHGCAPKTFKSIGWFYFKIQMVYSDFSCIFFVLLSFMTAAFIATSLCSDLSWISLPRTRDLCLVPFRSCRAELNIAHIYFKWRMRTYMLWEKCLFFFFFPKLGYCSVIALLMGKVLRLLYLLYGFWIRFHFLLVLSLWTEIVMSSSKVTVWFSCVMGKK